MLRLRWLVSPIHQVESGLKNPAFVHVRILPAILSHGRAGFLHLAVDE